MGIFTSCCDDSLANSNFPSLEIYEDSSSSSDSSLKAYGKSKDISPLIEGPISLAFQDLNLSETSTTDIDLETDQIKNLLKDSEDSENNSKNDKEEKTDSDTTVFKNVNVEKQ